MLSGQLLAIAAAWTATWVVAVVRVSTEHMERRVQMEAMVDAVQTALEDCETPSVRPGQQDEMAPMATCVAVAAVALEDRQYVKPLRRACAKLWRARLQRRNARLPHAQACAKLWMWTTSMRFVLPSKRVWLRAWDPRTSRKLWRLWSARWPGGP